MRNFSSINNRQSIRILDLGCGGGNNLYFLQEQGFDFRAIDGAPESIRLSKKYLGLDDNDTRVIEGDFCKLPYEDNMFDAVIDRAAIGCNLFKDICSIADEIHRVLKPKGSYFSTDLCSEEHPDLCYGRELDNDDYIEFSEGTFYFAQQIHAFNPEQIRRLFNKFESVKIDKIQHNEIKEKEEKLVNVSYEITAKKQ
jgi:ubiquinone/menaquinone biosynthesis C-methylase UbiE